LPDGWEIAHGLNPASSLGADGADGDPDGDEFPNLAEFRNGTQPRDAGDRLRLRAYRSAWEQLTCFFEAPPGGLFVLESSTHPGTDSWQPERTVTATTASTVVFTLQTRSGRERFFRLRSP
jgi:hypothetical protein